MKQQYGLNILLLCLSVLMTGCRTDDIIVYGEEHDTGVESKESGLRGMYVLCEGNMGSNKCTLDFLDLSARDSTIRYRRNIYAERNPRTVKELGDVGNDIGIYGSKLWLVINCSNKVEVCTADSCRRLGQVDIPNCRSLAFDGRFAYVSSFVGPVVIDGDAPLGRVYKIDTLSLQKVDSVVVGYQPEELAVVGRRLYVANSGGYRVPEYDRTVSVIDLTTFKEERQLDVAINLQHCRADRLGQLWLTSRGDYGDEGSRLYVIKPTPQGELQWKDSIDVAVSNLCIVGDSLYYYGSYFDIEQRKNVVNYGIINIRSREVVTTQLSEAPQLTGIEMPYGIIVNPTERDFYLMDARNYVSSGQLLHFKSDGTFDYRVWTGDIPGHAAFLYKNR